MKKLLILISLIVVSTISNAQILNNLSWYKYKTNAIVTDSTVTYKDTDGTIIICYGDPTGLIVTTYTSLDRSRKSVERSLNMHEIVGDGVWKTSQLRNGKPVPIYLELVKIKGYKGTFLKSYIKK